MQTIVIGHGKSPDGRGWGSRIDSAQRVVRMWNWHWQSPADHGTRYDWGLLEVHKLSMRDWKEHNQAKPQSGWIASLLLKYRDMQKDLPDTARVVDQRQWLQMLPHNHQGCGATGQWQLTRGGIAACWAVMSAREGDEVILVGCDNLRAGVALPLEEAFGDAYRADPVSWSFADYQGGVTKYGNHDFPAERKLIEFLGIRGSVAVGFAQDAWA